MFDPKEVGDLKWLKWSSKSAYSLQSNRILNFMYDRWYNGTNVDLLMQS